MRKRKISRVLIGMMLCAAAAFPLAGCADSVQTNEQIVVPKDNGEKQNGEDVEGASAADESGSAGGVTTGGLLTGIAEQVQAPDKYTAAFSEGNVHVKADADVVIPLAAGFKLYKVTGRTFTQEDYDNVNHVLLKDGKLWDRDWKQMEASNGLTREEIEKKIERLKEDMAGNEKEKLPGKAEDYGEAIAAWEERLKAAPEEPIITEIPAVVYHTENPDEAEKNYLTGNVTVDGEDYFVALDNTFDDNWRWIYFEVRSPRYQGSYFPMEEKNNIGESISAEEVKKQAQALIEELGFDEFVITGEEYVQAYSYDEAAGEEAYSEPVYQIHFSRELEGIPVTYTYEPGTTVEGDEPSWPYEAIDLVFGKEGLEHFQWTNPYEIEKNGDEYVFLLPFDDIQSVFEKIIIKEYADRYEGVSMEIYCEIDEVRLGYMRVREKGNAKEGTLIPVWDFFGSETIVYSDSQESYVTAGPYESLLTVNAMDGTVIDRGLGY